MKKKRIEKNIHFFLGSLLLVLSIIAFPFSITGGVVLNNSIKLNFLPLVSFVIAIVEIYIGVRLK